MGNSAKQSMLIVGAGNMGVSIARGLLADHWTGEQLVFCEQRLDRHDYLRQEFQQSGLMASLPDLTSVPNIILLAVKPDNMAEVCRQLADAGPGAQALYISIAAGVPCRALKMWLGENAPIVRCMPNTPAAIGYGMTGLYTPPETDPEHKLSADSILKSIGLTLWVDNESLLDAVTAISGSGPAYFFYFMEALQKSGQSLGLNRQDCYRLALQTMLGAALLADHQNVDFAQLRINVTSRGGTTEQAIKCFMQHRMDEIIDAAVYAATARAREISRSFVRE